MWRGFEAQAGFVQGEWNYTFISAYAFVEDPSGAVYEADVSYSGTVNLKFRDGPHAGRTLSALMVGLSNGPETTTMALCFAVEDQDVPLRPGRRAPERRRRRRRRAPRRGC